MFKIAACPPGPKPVAFMWDQQLYFNWSPGSATFHCHQTLTQILIAL